MYNSTLPCVERTLLKQCKVCNSCQHNRASLYVLKSLVKAKRLRRGASALLVLATQQVCAAKVESLCHLFSRSLSSKMLEFWDHKRKSIHYH